jgi:hypothetical protein
MPKSWLQAGNNGLRENVEVAKVYSKLQPGRLRRSASRGLQLMMRLLRRVVIWVGEIVSESVLLMVLLTSLWWRPQGSESLVDVLKLWFFWSLFLFMVGSGYLVSTALFGVILRSSIRWVYPAIAATLFVFHIQFFPNGWTLGTRIPVQAGGACIVFICCYGGNWCLRRWSQTMSTSG